MFKGKSVDAEALISVTEQLYKYQNYKGTIAAQKIKTDRYMPTSVIALHSLLRRYLTTGEKDLKRTNPLFYQTIDELKQKCYTPLTPSLSEQAKVYTSKTRTTKNKCKVIKTESNQINNLNNIQNNNKINISSETLDKIRKNESYIGVQIKDAIKLFNNEDTLSGFISAFSFMENPPQYKKVKVVITEL